MNMLSIPQRSVMGVSKPVAASEDGAIIAFDNAFMQEHANGDQELIDALENGLDRLMHKVPKIVFVPIDQWPQIRKTYIQQHKVTGQSKPAAETNHDDEQTSASAETQPATKTEVVEKAEQLFGEDVVEVKTD